MPPPLLIPLSARHGTVPAQLPGVGATLKAEHCFGITTEQFEQFLGDVGYDVQKGWPDAMLSVVKAQHSGQHNFDKMSGYTFIHGVKYLLRGQEKKAPSNRKAVCTAKCYDSLPGKRTLLTDSVIAKLRAGDYADPDTDGKSLCEILGMHSRANVFLSHPQIEDVRTTLATMRAYDKMRETERGWKSTHFWLDYISLDQTGGGGSFSRESRDGVPWAWDVIRACGALALPLDPWDDPQTLKRLWCAFEVAGASQHNVGHISFGVPIRAVLPPQQLHKFIDELKRGYGESIMKNICTTDMKKAACSLPEDMEKIHEMIQRGAGFEQTNKDVVAATWSALLDAGLDFSSRAEEDRDGWLVVKNLGLQYRKLGQYAKAEPLLRRAVDIARKVSGGDSADAATSYDELAQLHSRLGEHAEALPLLQKAIAITEKALGGDHPDLAASYSNLAGLRSDCGQYAEALPLYKKAVAIMEKAHGGDHVEVAASYNNLAVLYEKLGEKAEALPLYQKAIAIEEKALGGYHPSLATSYANLAVLYEKLGEKADALPLYLKAIAIQEKALGGDHPSLAVNYFNLADLHEARGEDAEAVQLYEKNLAIKLKVYGVGDPKIKSTYNALARLYMKRGEHDKVRLLRGKCGK